MSRSIIIEDELDAQKLLSSIIKDYCPTIQVIGIASNINQGVQLIETLRPDLLFLDIQLGEETGFQLLNQLRWTNFKLIITTAYKEFALEAFKYEAIDYILKPYSPNSISTAVSRVANQQQDAALYQKLDALLNKSNPLSKLQLNTQDGIVIVDTKEIIRIEADRSYCKVFLTNGQTTLLSKSLKDIESLLPSKNFFRIHTSYLININHLSRYSREDGGYVVMSDKAQIPIARRRKNEFLELLNPNQNP